MTKEWILVFGLLGIAFGVLATLDIQRTSHRDACRSTCLGLRYATSTYHRDGECVCIYGVTVKGD